MRTLALMAAGAALLLSVPAFAETVTARVVAVDPHAHTLTLDDRTVMIIAPEVDLSQVKPGQMVAISADGDDDGFSPATAVTPVQ